MNRLTRCQEGHLYSISLTVVQPDPSKAPWVTSKDFDELFIEKALKLDGNERDFLKRELFSMFKKCYDNTPIEESNEI